MKNLFILFFNTMLLFGCSSEHGNQLVLSGTLESVESTISSKVIGEVIKIFADEGTKISVNDTLCLIDESDYRIQLKQAAANVKVAEAQYLLLLHGARKEDVQQAEENFKQAEATFKNAETDFNRIKNLFNTGGVSEKEKDDASTRFLVAQAQYNSAKQLFEKIRTGSRTEEIDAAKARLAQAIAQEESIQKKMSDCAITSLVSGYVTKRLIEKAELVNTGSPLFRISNLDEMHIWVYLPSTQLGKIHLGDEANVTIDTYPGKEFSGKIIHISPEAEFTPKNIQTKEERVKLVFGVKVRVSNPQHTLKAGLPADVKIKLKTSNE